MLEATTVREILTTKMVLILKINGSSSPPLFRALVLLTSSGELRIWVDECIVNEYTHADAIKNAVVQTGAASFHPAFTIFRARNSPLLSLSHSLGCLAAVYYADTLLPLCCSPSSFTQGLCKCDGHEGSSYSSLN